MTRRTGTRRGGQTAARAAQDAPVEATAPDTGTTEAAGGDAALVLEGELTIHTAGERRAELLALVERGDRLTVDLSAVTELDTAGRQLLPLARREAAGDGKTFEISAASKAVTEALAIVHLGLALTSLTPAQGAGR